MPYFNVCGAVFPGILARLLFQAAFEMLTVDTDMICGGMRLRNSGLIIALAVFAFILSIIVGIFSGVGIWTIIFRALISGVVFGGIGILIFTLIERFVPELFDSATVNNVEGAGDFVDEKEAGNIDILLPDENPHSESDPGLESGLVEEVEEASVDFETDSGEEKTENEETPKADIMELIGNVEDLPELEDFSSTYSSEAPAGSGVEDGTENGSDFYSGGNSRNQPEGAEDPSIMARAVQTIMKKDQEE